MPRYDEPATLRTVLPSALQLGALSKVLIAKGVISKIDLTNELSSYKQTASDELKSEIDDLIATIDSW